ASAASSADTSVTLPLIASSGGGSWGGMTGTDGASGSVRAGALEEGAGGTLTGASFAREADDVGGVSASIGIIRLGSRRASTSFSSAGFDFVFRARLTGPPAGADGAFDGASDGSSS